MLNFEEFIRKYEMHYEIVRLKHQQGKSFKEIANQFNLSITCINQKYQRFLHSLYKYYAHYLKSINVILSKREIYDFYKSVPISVAYLEKTYKQYLDPLRCKIPPIIFEEHMNIPPFRNLTEENILKMEMYIVEAREKRKKTFFDIGRELQLSREKAKSIYDFYYHKKISKAFERIKPTVNYSVKKYIFNRSYASYKRWQLIANEYAELIYDLID